MALFLPLHGDMRGSIGDNTWARNHYGAYVRRRVGPPINPPTTAQANARAAFSQATLLWQTLSDTLKSAWNVYAAGSPWTNKLGQTVLLTGHARFVRTWSQRFLAGGSAAGLSKIAPATLGEAIMNSLAVTFGFVLTDSTSVGLPPNSVNCVPSTWASGTNWANTQTGAPVFLQCSGPTSLGVFSPPGPWYNVIAANEQGCLFQSLIPNPAATISATLRGALETGQRYFFRTRYVIGQFGGTGGGRVAPWFNFIGPAVTHAP
jgi:hypothetical protein